MPHGGPEGAFGLGRSHARPRFACAFGDMRIAIDHLKIGQAPEAKKLRPWPAPMLAPDLEERHAMIDLRRAQEPLPGSGAAMALQPLQQAHLPARRVPEP